MIIPTTNGMQFTMYFTWDTNTTNIANNTVGTKSPKAGEGRTKVDFESERVTEIDFKSEIKTENENDYD
jgi:hypothetical protein